MKFRNKATKEIRKAEMRDDGIYLFNETAEEWRKCDWKVLAKYWEEYIEEPKEYYCIDWTEPNGIYKTLCEDARDDFNKEIGNYFDTREKAELAVKKLKAWKRLKDKGFRFVGWDKALRRQEPCDFAVFCDFDGLVESERDLDLLFGGEE